MDNLEQQLRALVALYLQGTCGTHEATFTAPDGTQHRIRLQAEQIKVEKKATTQQTPPPFYISNLAPSELVLF